MRVSMTDVAEFPFVPNPLAAYEDPLDEDASADIAVSTTRRGLIRLALVAAETASRFAREGIATDPMAWMLAPRGMFDGRCAVDACVDRGSCVRAILVHGLGLGLDAEPAELDELFADDADNVGEVPEGCGPASTGPHGVPVDLRNRAPRRLYTSTSSFVAEDGLVQTFDALVTDDPGEAAVRFGGGIGDRSDWAGVTEGFDPAEPLVEALVSPAMADMLIAVAAAPDSPLAAGLSIRIEQRFAE